MKVEDYGRCVICKIPSSPSVRLVRENFSGTPTFRKTLEMMWGRIVGSKVDPKNIFEEMTKERGALLCFPCLAVLHAGMGLVSEIMKLEERLRNLLGKITVDGAMISYKKAKRRQKRPRDAEHTVDDTKEIEDEGPQNTICGFRDSSNKGRHGKSSDDNGLKPFKPQSNLTKLKKESASSAPVKSDSRPTPKTRFTVISGVQKCPSCDYTVDVRTPEQVAQSPGSLSPSVRRSLYSKSRCMLGRHFQNVHLGASGMKKFALMKNIGGMKLKKVYKCLECPYASDKDLPNVIRHYVNVHVRQRPVPVTTDRFSLPCPEKDCSFAAFEAVKSGSTVTKTNNKYSGNMYTNTRMYTRMREALSSHVIRYHDRRSVSTEPYYVPTSLYVETEDKKREYRCTRCDYRDQLSDKISTLPRLDSRRMFLTHFFNAHLRDLISYNPILKSVV